MPGVQEEGEKIKNITRGRERAELQEDKTHISQ